MDIKLYSKGKITIEMVLFTNDPWLYTAAEPQFLDVFERIKILVLFPRSLIAVKLHEYQGNNLVTRKIFEE